jgi:hypothetical protein
MRKTFIKVAAANLLLWSLALAVSCNCVCSNKPGGIGTAASRAPGQPSDDKRVESWRFVVSGDSRNCGDVVMPAIAAGAKTDGAVFYWHLGDLRAIYDFDQDMVQAAKVADKPLTISDYEKNAWEDFKSNQIAPFENIPMPFYLGIGNHETIAPKNRCEFAKSFERFLKKTEFKDSLNPPQGAQPGPGRGTGKTSKSTANANSQSPVTSGTDTGEECEVTDPKTYYHWRYPLDKPTVDFIYLDNASDKQFNDIQVAWFEGVIKQDEEDKSISTVVVGMHKALPWSVACDHSMNERPNGSMIGTKSGEIVYRKLLDLQKKKKVYVLASHSHYFMKDIFNTSHWRNEGVLPGWIIGTAGAQRYPLPPGADLTKSKTYVYGYLLARVYSDGTIDFSFTELKQDNIPTDVKNRYTESWIDEACFDGNRKTDASPEPAYCKEGAEPKQ